MRPIYIFAECSCVKPRTLAIQALFQQSFDGECVHFIMRCLHCDTECLIKEPFDDYEYLAGCEKEVMDYLESEYSQNYLTLALTGRTYTASKDWKGGEGETTE